MATFSQPLLADSGQATAEFQSLLNVELRPQLLKLLDTIENQTLQHLRFSLDVKHDLLLLKCPAAYGKLRDYPEDVLRIGNELATASLQTVALVEGRSSLTVAQSKVSLRITEFPLSSPFHIPSLPTETDVNKFCVFSAFVTSQSNSKLVELTRSYMCRKCGFSQTSEAVRSFNYFLPKTMGKCPVGCKKSTMLPLSTDNPSTVAKENAMAYQEIIVEPLVRSRATQTLDRQLTVLLKGADLPHSVTVGDDISIAGYLSIRYPPTLNEGEQPELQYVLEAIDVVHLNQGFWGAQVPESSHRLLQDLWDNFQSPVDALVELMNRLFPDIIGLGVVKLGMTLLMIGGDVTEQDESFGIENDSEWRSKGHLMLVGIPGCGKSVLLLSAVNLITNSIMLQGSSATNVGLTASMLSTASEGASIAPGSLLLARNAILGIDEFATMSQQAMNALHQAMESGKISITKACLKIEVPVLCSVFGAMNPQPDAGANYLHGIPETIISRFDLIFSLPAPSASDPASDRVFAEKIIRNISAEQRALVEPGSWSKEIRRDMFLVFRAFQVRRFEKEAMRLVRAYFIAIRQLAERDPARTGNRLIASVVRLSVSTAKLMRHTEVAVSDVLLSLCLIDISLGNKSLTKISVHPTADFSVEMFTDFKTRLSRILSVRF